MPSSLSIIPSHVGIIMDGNGRWAKAQNRPRTFGHTQGLKAAKKAISFAAKMGIKYITLYTFSTENWKRTQEEVGFLFSLITKHLKNEMNFYKKTGVCLKMCGDKSALPAPLQKEIDEVILETSSFNKITVVLAINYGGKDEIVRAVNRAISSTTENGCISEATIKNHLDNPDIPDPDLIIRTAGEQRLSNFLLWQSAYSEYYFTKTLWPDFDEIEFTKALEAFSNRERKFGGIK